MEKDLGPISDTLTHVFLSHPTYNPSGNPDDCPLKYIHRPAISHPVYGLHRGPGHHHPLSGLVTGPLTCLFVSALLLLTICSQRSSQGDVINSDQSLLCLIPFNGFPSYLENSWNLMGPRTPYTTFAFLPYSHWPRRNASKYASHALGWGSGIWWVFPLLENLVTRGLHGSPVGNLCSDFTFMGQPSCFPQLKVQSTPHPLHCWRVFRSTYHQPEHSLFYFCLPWPLREATQEDKAFLFNLFVHCYIPNFKNSKYLVSIV